MRRFLANNRIWLVKENQITADEKALLLGDALANLTEAEEAFNALSAEDNAYSEASASYQKALSSYEAINAKRTAAPKGAVELTPEQLERHLSDDYTFDAALGDFVKKTKTVEEQTALANSECTARIEAQWNQIGQNNAMFGLYGEEAKLACGLWISAHREALAELLAQANLIDLDVTDNTHWPEPI